MLEVFPLDQAHIHVKSPVDLPEVVDWHHMGIVEPRGRKRLAPEPLFERWIGGQLRRQHLYRHYALCGRIEGLPDLTHTAAAQKLDQLVPAERRSLHDGPLTAIERVPHSR